MQSLIRTLAAVMALSLCLPVMADEIERSNPEWSALMKEARRLWYVGDFDAGNEILLQAVELARNSSEPLTLARSLDLAAKVANDPNEKMRLLEEAYKIKESTRGPRYVGLADTLLSMGHVAGRLAFKKGDDGTDPDPSTYQPVARKFYYQARDILLEAHGEGCEVGQADKFIAMSFERLDPSKAEKLFREILVYCPIDPEDYEWEKPSITARVQLKKMLRAQGREAEAAELPELPELIEPDYGEPSPGYEAPPDVLVLPAPPLENPDRNLETLYW